MVVHSLRARVTRFEIRYDLFIHMHALEFILNGERLCTAAPSGDGLVISHVVMTESEYPTGSNPVQLRVAGVQGHDHLEWILRSLALGDSLEIRIVDTRSPDAPRKVHPVTESQRERLRIASGEA